MANSHLTAVSAKRLLPVMPVQLVPDGDRGTGIHSPRTGNWIPAFAGMTTGERVDRCDAARREAARLAADAEDMAMLENAERALEGKGRGKKK